MKNKIPYIPLFLWFAVIVTFSILAYVRYLQIQQLTEGQTETLDPPGRFLTDIQWKHFVDVPPFEMTNQQGNRFDSATLAGKPFLLNFFFARCPSSCRDLNAQMATVNEQLRKEDLHFVSITIDPDNDSPEVLQRYSQDYDAQIDRWVFLTDQLYKIRQLGEQVFEVPIGNNPQAHTHTEDILLVDKWGRFRDRFRWDDPVDMRRLLSVVKDVCAETSPPLERTFRTRNAMAGQAPLDLSRRPWLREFHLTKPDGTQFYSRDMTGSLWIVGFLGQMNDVAESRLNDVVAQLSEGFDEPVPVFMIEIPSDGADSESNGEFPSVQSKTIAWTRLTGDLHLIERIGAEFFGIAATGESPPAKLFVIDRWHQVRGSFDWRDTDSLEDISELIRRLNQEKAPVYDVKPIPRTRNISTE